MAFSDADATLLSTVLFAGMFVGAHVNGALSDRHGRRAGVLSALAACAVCGALAGAAPSYPWLLAARFGVGVGVGGSPAAITLYTEVLPHAGRGRRLMLQSVAFTAGAVFVAALAATLLPRAGWRLFLAAAALPAAVSAALCYCRLPESPRFLLAAGRVPAARVALARAARANGVPPPPLLHDGASSDPAPSPIIRPWSRLVWPLTAPLSVLFAGMAAVYYGVALLSVTLEEAAARDPCALPAAAHGAILTENASELAGLAAAALLLDRVGRRATIAAMFLACAAALLLLLLLLTLSSSSSPLAGLLRAGLLCVVRAAALGFNQSLWVYAAEAYPTALRVHGVGFTSAFARLGSMASPLLAVVLLRRSPAATLAVCAALCAAAAALARRLPPERRLDAPS
jgi:MFS family permease